MSDQIVFAVREHAERFEKSLAEVKADAAKEVKSLSDKLDSSLTELAQKSATAGGYQGHGHKSANPLASVVNSAEVKALATRQSRNTATITLDQGIGLLTKAAVTNDTYPAEAQRLPGWGADARRPMRLLDVIPKVQMTTGSAQYIRLGAYSNAAGYQLTEGTAKPEATVPTSLITVEAATIAHWLPCSTQVLADAPSLEAQLRGLLMFGLADKVERELLTGAGTAGTIAGMAGIAATYVHTATAPADRIGQAAASLQSLGWQPSIVILNPADWFLIASERSTDGYVAAGGWNQPARPNVWGLDVVLSSAQTAGTALVADPAQMAILDRQSAVVEVGYTGDGFIRNEVVLRAELRAALAIYSPASLVEVSLI